MLRLQQAIESLSAEAYRAKDVQASCTSALTALGDIDRHFSLAQVYEAEAQQELRKELYATLWRPFHLATQKHMSVRLRELALDAIQKLVVHGLLLGEDTTKIREQMPAGHVQNQTVVLSSSSLEISADPPTVFQEIRKPSIDIVKAIGEAVSGKTPEDVVQIQAVKALLSLVTSPNCQVHGRTLMEVVEICFYVATTPSGASNVPQATAKASLTQIVNFIVLRLNEEYKQESTRNGHHRSSSMPEHVAIELMATQTVSSRRLSLSPKAGPESETSTQMEEVKLGEPPKAEPEDKSGTENFSDIPQSPLEAAEAVEATEKTEVIEKTEKTEATQVSPDQDMDEKSVSGKDDLIEKYGLLIRPNVEVGNFKELLQRDVLLILHQLIRCAGEDSEGTPERVAFSISLAFEMVLSMLKKGVASFKRDDIFVQFVRDELCPAILQHSKTEDPTLFEICLAMFIIILNNFRANLKPQIAKLLDELIFPILDREVGDNSVYKRKYLLLQAVYKICDNTTVLIDLYQMFDCDPESPSYFERLVNSMSRIAHGRSSKKGSTAMGGLIGSHAAGLLLDINADLEAIQDERSKVRGLRCLATIVKSLKERGKLEDTQPPSPVPISVKTRSNSPELSQKHPESNINKVVKVFNSAPQEALNLLTSNGLVQGDNASIARFLIETEGISASSLGNFLGDAQNEELLSAVLDQLKLKDIEFVVAIRSYLSHVGLCADLDKTDHLIVTFANRYCQLNSDVFANANAAYILAHSAVMLNYELYFRPETSTISCKEIFVRRYRMLKHDTDVSDEFLGLVYEEIAKAELFVPDKKRRKKSSRSNISLQNLRTSASAPKQQYPKGHPMNGFERPPISSLVPKMFDILWPALIATLSVAFEQSTGSSASLNEQSSEALRNEVIQLCLSAFHDAIWISSFYSMETQRDAFVSSLCRLTGLNDIGQMKPKNHAAVRTMLNVANSCGEYLGSSWMMIVDVVSQLERLQLASGESNSQAMSRSGSLTTTEQTRKQRIPSITMPKGDDPQSPRVPTRKNSFVSNVFSTDSDITAVNSTAARSATNFLGSLVSVGINSAVTDGNSSILENISKEFQSQDIVVALDQLFTNSATISCSSLLHLYQALCQVSLIEIDAVPSRMFCLQKLVEITRYNVKRNLFEWSQIWQILQSYFETIGCHPEIQIAEYAVSSYRTLCLQLLSRKELSHFQTNLDTLRPFQHIMAQTLSPVIEDLILRSIGQIIELHAQNIKSGWLAIFSTLGQAGTKQNISTVTLALELHQSIAEMCIEMISPNSFAEVIKSVLVFSVHPTNTSVVGGSLNLLSRYGGHLSNLYKENNQITEKDVFLQWFPIFSGLTRTATLAPSDEMRTKVLDGLFEIFKSYGSQFSINFWESIFSSILIPLFEGLNDNAAVVTEADLSTWMRTLQFMSDLFCIFFDTFAEDTSILSKILSLMQWMLEKRHEEMNQHAVTVYLKLVEENCHRLSTAHWAHITEAMQKYIALVTPNELIIDPVPQPNEMTLQTENLDFPNAVAKCTLLLFHIQNFDNLLRRKPELSHYMQQTQEWLSCFHSSYLFARRFNEDMDLRNYLWKAGFIKQMPNLFKQEMVALAAFLRLGFALYREYGDEEPSAQQLMEEVERLLEWYNTLIVDATKFQREIINWTPTVVMVWEEIQVISWENNKLRARIPKLFQLAVTMLSCEKSEVRQTVQQFLAKAGNAFIK